MSHSPANRTDLSRFFRFPQVTTIAEALALHKSLEAKNVGEWKRETDEEYEDADGNVYNKKTYEDLRKQGLI